MLSERDKIILTLVTMFAPYYHSVSVYLIHF